MDSVPENVTTATETPPADSQQDTPRKSAPPIIPPTPTISWQTPPAVYKLTEEHKRLLQAIKKWTALTYVRDKRRILSPYEMRQAIDPEETGRLAEAHLARGASRLESWRNMLVVVPLLLTWLSLGLAAAAYQQSVGLLKVGQSVPPFFQAWQEGFPTLTVLKIWSLRVPLQLGHFHYLTFTDVALVDCVILISLLALTALSQWVAIRAHRRAHTLQLWLGERLFDFSKDSIAWSVSPAEQDKPRWAAEVQFTLNAVTDVLGKVSSVVHEFEGSLARQGQIVGGIVDDAGDVTHSVAELTKFYQLVYESYRELYKVLPEVSGHLATLAASEVITTNEWKHMVGNLDFAIRSITDISGRLGGPDLYEDAVRFQEAYHKRQRRPLSSRVGSAWRGFRGR